MQCDESLKKKENSNTIAPTEDSTSKITRIPEWLRRDSSSSESTRELKKLLRTHSLNTVCEEARCPNISECFSHGTATFMILGDICTRGCRFCSVITGKPTMSQNDFKKEASEIVKAISIMKLKYAVITSVARDDLSDGGASGFVHTIKAIQDKLPSVKIEVLIPDLRGNWDSLQKIVEAKPNVLNHNIETVPRLYRRVRPGATLARSLELLKTTKLLDDSIKTKTGVMLGLGEKREEVEQVMRESAANFVDIFTAGQYMQPSRTHLPVDRYLDPAEFEDLAKFARSNNLFKEVYMGPLVRSSYHAGEVASTII